MASFSGGQTVWIERLGNLRNVIRQEMIRRHLAEHVPIDATVLDVGCGQGTQAIELARRGCTVTGVEPSPELRALCSAGAAEADVSIELVDGTIERLEAAVGGRTFDAVCAHGLLMYLDDRDAAVAALAARVAPGGVLSLTFRNGHALAYRPGLRGDWAGALAAMETDQYVNGLGVSARADLLDDVTAEIERAGLTITTWFGVRIFNDGIDGEVQPPDDPEELQLLLDAEDQAGRRDPYRSLAAQFHVIARGPTARTGSDPLRAAR